MVESPLSIILNMVILIIDHTIKTLGKLYQLFIELLNSLGFIAAVGGVLGLVISIVIITLVGFFLAKFVFKTVKGMIILFSVGVIIALILILSYI